MLVKFPTACTVNQIMCPSNTSKTGSNKTMKTAAICGGCLSLPLTHSHFRHMSTHLKIPVCQSASLTFSPPLMTTHTNNSLSVPLSFSIDFSPQPQPRLLASTDIYANSHFLLAVGEEIDTTRHHIFSSKAVWYQYTGGRYQYFNVVACCKISSFFFSVFHIDDIL